MNIYFSAKQLCIPFLANRTNCHIFHLVMISSTSGNAKAHTISNIEVQNVACKKKKKPEIPYSMGHSSFLRYYAPDIQNCSLKKTLKSK